MSKKHTQLLIGILLLITIKCVLAEDYKPLSEKQALKYIEHIDKNSLALEIIKLDIIEHSMPEILFPEITAEIDGDDLIIKYESDLKKNVFELSIVNPGVKGLPVKLLSYEISLDEIKFNNFFDNKLDLKPVFSVSVSTIIGIFSQHIGLSPEIKIPLGFLLSASSFFVIQYIL